MVALLGSLLGFLVSVFPEILKHLAKRQELDHLLALRQLPSLDEGDAHHGMPRHGMARHEEMILAGNQREQEALIKSLRPSSIRWIEGLASLVRPLITYAFFLLYVGVKVAQFCLLVKSSSWEGSLLRMWGEEDQLLFSAVVSFWFGHRAMTKGRT